MLSYPALSAAMKRNFLAQSKKSPRAPEPPELPEPPEKFSSSFMLGIPTEAGAKAGFPAGWELGRLRDWPVGGVNWGCCTGGGEAPGSAPGEGLGEAVGDGSGIAGGGGSGGVGNVTEGEVS